MKILHLIPSLGSGGAERMLLRIAHNDLKNQHIVVIIKNIDNSSVFYNIDHDNIKLYSLKYTTLISAYSAIKLYLNYLDIHSPDVIQTWMYHSNLMGGVLARIKGYKNIVWNIRSAEISFRSMKKTTILLVFVEAFLSYFIPKSIVSCSKRAINVHKDMFYSKKKFVYIPNGIQDHYILDRKLNTNKKPVVGFVARLDAQKNHVNFLKSIEYIDHSMDFILLGYGVETINLSEYEIGKNVSITLLGEVSDVFSLYDSFDFLILPSIYGEAFPNVLMEAMSRGVVCISSNVGDSFSIMSLAGYRVADPFSPISIAKALNGAIEDFELDHSSYQRKSNSSMLRIRSNYRLTDVIAKYNRVWLLK
jgi:glycosyltransferase involved in cell wall biosynthesis